MIASMAVIFVLFSFAVATISIVIKRQVVRETRADAEQRMSWIKSDVDSLKRFRGETIEALSVKYSYLRPFVQEDDSGSFWVPSVIIDTPDGKMIEAEGRVGAAVGIQAILDHLGMELSPGNVCEISVLNPVLIRRKEPPSDRSMPALRRRRK